MLREISHHLAKAVGVAMHPPKQHKADAGGRAQLLISMKTNIKEIYKNAKKTTKFTLWSEKFVSEKLFFIKMLTCD